MVSTASPCLIEVQETAIPLSPADEQDLINGNQSYSHSRISVDYFAGIVYPPKR